MRSQEGKGMEHERFEELWSEERDGLLGEAEKRELAGHLADCGDCRKRSERWSQYSKTILRPMPRPSAQDSQRFARVVMARIRQEAAEAPRSWWFAWRLDQWLVPALSASVVAAALAIALAPVRSASPAPDEAFLLSQCDGLAKWCVPPSRATVGQFIRDLED